MNGDTIYHVCLGGKLNRYFGSIAAIYDVFTAKDLGVSKTRLWAYGVRPDRPYENGKVVIRKEHIRRKKTGRKRPK